MKKTYQNSSFIVFQFSFQFCCIILLFLFISGIVDDSLFFLMRSLRVNLDMGKSAYGWMIMKDENIPGTVVRTSTIPEELGRLVYLLTDKTGRCPSTLNDCNVYSRFLVLKGKVWVCLLLGCMRYVCGEAVHTHSNV